MHIISTTFHKKYLITSRYNFFAIIRLDPPVVAKTCTDPCILLDIMMFMVRHKRTLDKAQVYHKTATCDWLRVSQ